MKKVLLILAGMITAGGMMAQSAISDPRRPARAPELAVRAKPMPALQTQARLVTPRMQHIISKPSPAGSPAFRAPMKAPEDINLIGFVSDGNTVNEAMGGMYRVPYRASQQLERISMMTIYNYWGGVESGGTYYTAYQLAFSPTMAYNYMYMYDTSTWMSTGYKMLTDFSLFSSAQANDPTDNTVYGCYMNADATGYEYGTADFENGTHVTIKTLDKPWSVCAIDAAGVMYAIDLDGALYTVEKATGEMTLVGKTGVTSTYLGGGVYDDKGGRILWSVCSDMTSEIYSVDPKTAEASLLTTVDGNKGVMGMFIGAPLAEDAAPEQARNLVADFPNGSLSGTISFDIPAETYGGTPGEGEVSWSITSSGLPMGSGKAAYGEHVDASVTAYMSGNTTFIVSLSNDAGAAPDAKVSLFLGKGTPAIPVVYLSYDDVTETVTLDWEPVTKAIDDGYFDPADITYSVTRYPGNVLVAEHITESQFSENLPIPASVTTYTYNVVAENGDRVSGYGATIPLRLGSYGVPYVEEFTDMSNVYDYKTYDLNGDGVTWSGSLGGIMLYQFQDFAMDDWLVSPGIELKKGHKYYIELTFRTLQTQPPYADIEVKLGDGPELADLSVQLIPTTQLNELSAAPFSTIHEATFDGKHYLGIHATAESSNWAQVCKIVIKEATMPGPATDVVVVPGADDSLNATVSFKAPAVDAAGDPLGSIEKIDVVRGGILVKTFTNPTPGETLTFDDSVYSAGDYQWVITAYNENGTGLEASIIKHVGINTPAMPQNIKAVEDGNTGMVTLTWNPVTTDRDGRPMSPQFINHRVVNGSTTLEDLTEVKECSYTARIAPEGEQAFSQMGLMVYNYYGSNVAFSDIMPVGAPYREYKESFADGAVAHSIAFVDVIDYTLWQLHNDAAMTSPGSVDKDGGCAMMYCQYAGGASTMLLGKFNLEGMTDPALGVSIYNIADADGYSHNTLEVLVDAGHGYESVALFQATKDDPWNTYVRHSVDLSKYVNAGNINIALRGEIVDIMYLPIDKITVGSTYAHDLSASGIQAPEKVSSGTDFTVNVVVENNGREVAKDFTVSLMLDGEVVDVKEIEELAADAVSTIGFACRLSTLVGDEVTYSAKIDYAEDEKTSDNVTVPVAVPVSHAAYPAPGLLSAEVKDGAVHLSWTEPSTDIPDIEVTEGFEDGEAMVVDKYGDWTFYDGDKSPTYNYGNIYVGCQDPKAYAVLDYFEFGSAGEEYMAHSGNRYIAAVCNSNYTNNDDWAISPELAGGAQTVSFYARSLWDFDGGESFEFLYSTEGTDIESFQLVERVDGVPGTWTYYSYELPEGAKHFAIRCVSYYQYMFMVDDVTFTPAGGVPEDIHHDGYHIYRDGLRVNEDVVTGTGHVDTPAENGTYSYAVTAVYNYGESVPTNRVLVTFETDGLNDVVARVATISTGDGTITVSGAEGLEVAIYDVAGHILAQTHGDTTVAVSTGCYLVRVGDETVKVIVK